MILGYKMCDAVSFGAGFCRAQSVGEREKDTSTQCSSLEDHSHLRIIGFIYGKFAVSLITDFVTDSF